MPRYKRSGFSGNRVTPDYIARELDKIQVAIDSLYNGELESIIETPTGSSPLLVYTDGTVDLGDGNFGLYFRHTNGNIYAINSTLVATPAVVARVVQRVGKVHVRGYQQGVTADIQLPADTLTGLIRIIGYAQQIVHEETHLSRVGNISVVGNQLDVEIVDSPTVSEFLLRPNGVYSRIMWSTLAQRIKAGTSPYASRFSSLTSYANGRLSQTSNAPAFYSVPLFYNDSTGHINAKAQLQGPMFTAYSCAAVYYLNKLISGTNPSSNQYADKALAMLMNWANNNTSMDSSGNDTSLVVSYVMPAFIDAAELIYDYPGFTSSNKTAVSNWLENVVWPRVNATKLRSLQANADGTYTVPSWIDPTKPIFSSGGPYYSNHNCHGIRCSLTICKYLQDSATFTKDINLWKALVGFLIRNDGGMPSELARGENSILYTGFALESLSSAAELVRNCGGASLFDYQTPTNQPPGTYQGGSLRKALNYVYNNGIATPSNWPSQSAVGNYGNHLQETLLAMGYVYQVSAWRNWANSITGTYAMTLPDLETGSFYPLPTMMEHLPL